MKCLILVHKAGLLWLISLGALFSTCAQAWNFDYILPGINASRYITPTDTPTFTFNVSYSIRDNNGMPIPVISGQKNMRVQILVPPGTSLVTLFATGNFQDQKTEAALQDTNPGELGSGVRPPALTTINSSFNKTYGQVADKPFAEACYLYFTLYHQPDGDNVLFATYNTSFFVRNVSNYAIWQQKLATQGSGSLNLSSIKDCSTATRGDTLITDGNNGSGGGTDGGGSGGGGSGGGTGGGGSGGGTGGGGSGLTGTWDIDLNVPSLVPTDYSQVSAGAVTHIVKREYSSRGSPFPVQRISGSKDMRVKILMPPGATLMTLFTTGNFQDLKTEAGLFDTPIGNTFSGSKPAGLKTVISSINLSYPANGSFLTKPLTEPAYLTFLLHHPADADDLLLATFNVNIFIRDTAAYTTWRNARPWAGGLSSSVDGCAEASKKCDLTAPDVINIEGCPNPEAAPFNQQCTNEFCRYTVNVDTAGFYVANARLPKDCGEGFWGLSVITGDSAGSGFGGFSTGAILPDHEFTPGFATFNIRKDSNVSLTPQVFQGSTQQLTTTIKRIDSNGVRSTVFGPRKTEATNGGVKIDSGVLTPGRYLLEILNEASQPRSYFGVSLTGLFTGGVDFGGFIDSTTSGAADVGGFSQFSVNSPQNIELQLFMRDFYANDIGAKFIYLDIFRIDPTTGERTLYWSSEP